METYTFLRQLADSWMMLALFGVFIAVILLLFRPGASKLHNDAAMIPLRDETFDHSLGEPAAEKQEEKK